MAKEKAAREGSEIERSVNSEKGKQISDLLKKMKVVPESEEAKAESAQADQANSNSEEVASADGIFASDAASLQVAAAETLPLTTTESTFLGLTETQLLIAGGVVAVGGGTAAIVNNNNNNGPNPTVGDVNLTTAKDAIVIVGDNVNHVNGLIGTGGTSTYTAGDAVDGNGKTVLDLSVDAAVVATGNSAAASDVTLSDIDAVNISSNASSPEGYTLTIDAQNWSDVGSVNLSEGALDLQINNLEAATALSIENGASGVLAAAYDNSVDVSLSVSGEEAQSSVSLDGGVASATVGADNAVSITADVSSESSTNLSVLSGGVTASLGSDAALNVDVSNSSGGNIAVGAITITSANGSSGADAAVSVEGYGSGAQTVSVGAVSFTGGSSSSGSFSLIEQSSGSATLGAVTVSTVADASLDVQGGATTTVGNVSLTNVGSADVTVEGSGSAAQTATIGTVSFTGTSTATSSFSLSESASGSATVGAVTVQTAADASLDVQGGATTTVGNVSFSNVGTADLSVSGSGEDEQTVTVGTVSFTGADEDSSELGVSVAGSGSTTVGNVSVTDANSADVSVAGMDVTVGDVSFDGVSNVSLDVSAAGNLSVGDVSFDTATTNASVQLSNQISSGEAVGDTTIGNLELNVASEQSATLQVEVGATPSAELDSYSVGQVDIGTVSITLAPSADASGSGITVAADGDLEGFTLGGIDAQLGNSALLAVSATAESSFSSEIYGAAGFAVDVSANGNIGDVALGDLTINTGTFAHANVQESISAVQLFTSTLESYTPVPVGDASIGNVSIGDVDVTAGAGSTAAGIIRIAAGQPFNGLGGPVRALPSNSNDIGDVTVGSVSANIASAGLDEAAAAGVLISARGDVGDITVGTAEAAGNISLTVGLAQGAPELSNEAAHYAAAAMQVFASGSVGDVSLGDISLNVTGSDLGVLGGAGMWLNAGGSVGSVTAGDLSAQVNGDNSGVGSSGPIGAAGLTIQSTGEVASVSVGDISSAVTGDNAGLSGYGAALIVDSGGIGDVEVGSISADVAGQDSRASSAVILNASADSSDETSGSIGDVTLGDISAAVDYTGIAASALDGGSSSFASANLDASGSIGTVDLGGISAQIDMDETGSSGLSENSNAQASVYVSASGDVGDVTVSGDLTASLGSNFTVGAVGPSETTDSASINASAGLQLYSGEGSIGNVSLQNLEASIGNDVSVLAGSQAAATVTVGVQGATGVGNVEMGNLTATIGSSADTDASFYSTPLLSSVQVGVQSGGDVGTVTVGDLSATVGSDAGGTDVISSQVRLTVVADANAESGSSDVSIGDVSMGSLTAAADGNSQAQASVYIQAGGFDSGSFSLSSTGDSQFIPNGSFVEGDTGSIGNITTGAISVTATNGAQAQGGIVVLANGDIGDVTLVAPNDNPQPALTVSDETSTAGGISLVVSSTNDNYDYSSDEAPIAGLALKAAGGIGNITVGDVSATLAFATDTGSSDLYAQVGVHVSAGEGGIGNVTLGDLSSTVSGYEVHQHSSGKGGLVDVVLNSSGDIGDITVGDVTTQLTAHSTSNDGSSSQGTVLSANADGSIGNVTLGAVQASAVGLGVETGVNVSIAGDSVGNVELGDIGATLGSTSSDLDSTGHVQTDVRIIGNSGVATGEEVGSIGLGDITASVLSAGDSTTDADSSANVNVQVSSDSGSLGNVTLGDVTASLADGLVSVSNSDVRAGVDVNLDASENIGDITLGAVSAQIGDSADANAGSSISFYTADNSVVINAGGDIGDITVNGLSATIGDSVDASAGTGGLVLEARTSLDIEADGSIGSIQLGDIAGAIGDNAHATSGSGYASVTTDTSVDISASGDIGDVTIGSISASIGDGASAGAPVAGAYALISSSVSVSISSDDGSIGNITIGDVSATVGDEASASGAAGTGTGESAHAYVQSQVDLDIDASGDIGTVTLGSITASIGNSAEAIASGSGGGSVSTSVTVDASVDISASGDIGNVIVGAVSATIGNNASVQGILGSATISADTSLTLDANGTIGSVTIGDISASIGSNASLQVGSLPGVNSASITADVSVRIEGDGGIGAVTLGNLSATVGSGASGGTDDDRIHADLEVRVIANAGSSEVPEGGVLIGDVQLGSLTVAADGESSAQGTVLIQAGGFNYTGSGDAFIPSGSFPSGDAGNVGNITAGEISVTGTDGAQVRGGMLVVANGDIGNVTLLAATTDEQVQTLTTSEAPLAGNISLKLSSTLESDFTYTEDHAAIAGLSLLAAGSVGDITVGDITATLAFSTQFGDTADITAQVGLQVEAGEDGIGNVSLGDLVSDVSGYQVQQSSVLNGGLVDVRLATDGDIASISAGDVRSTLDATFSSFTNSYSNGTTLSANAGGDIGNITLADVAASAEGYSASTSASVNISAGGNLAYGDEPGTITLGGLYATATGDFSEATTTVQLLAGGQIGNIEVTGDVSVTNLGFHYSSDDSTSVALSVQADQGIGNVSVAAGGLIEVDVNDQPGLYTYSGVANGEVAITLVAGSEDAADASIGDLSLGGVGLIVSDPAALEEDIQPGIDSSASFALSATASGSIGDVTILGAAPSATAEAPALGFYLAAAGIGNSADATVSLQAGDSIGDITVGSISATAVAAASNSRDTHASLDFQVSAQGDIGTSSFGDVLLEADNYGANASVALVVSSTLDGSVGDMSIGDVTLKASSSLTSDNFAHAPTAGFVATLSGAAQVSAATMTVGDVSISMVAADTSATSSDVSAAANLQLVNLAGDLHVGDLSISNENASEDGYNALSIQLVANGDIELGTISISGDQYAHINGSSNDLTDLTDLLDSMTALDGHISAKGVDYSGLLNPDGTVNIDVSGLVSGGANNTITVTGSDYNDVITANNGRNLITGGEGDDIFRFLSTSTGTTLGTVSQILDWDNTADKLDVGVTFDLAHLYTEAGSAAASFAAFFASALNAIQNDSTSVYVGQFGSNVFVAVDAGQDHTLNYVIELANTNLSQIDQTSFEAIT